MKLIFAALHVTCFRPDYLRSARPRAGSRSLLSVFETESQSLCDCVTVCSLSEYSSGAGYPSLEKSEVCVGGLQCFMVRC